MKIENTRKRFTKRIEFERVVLSLVNGEISDCEPLYGLSSSAISFWEANSSYPNTIQIVTHLKIISKSLQVFCDNSKNAFELDKRINSNDMSVLIKELANVLGSKNNKFYG